MQNRAPDAARLTPLRTPSDLGDNATTGISAALTGLLADMFALYLRSKISIGTCPDLTFATTICCSTSRVIRYSRRPTS